MLVYILTGLVVFLSLKNYESVKTLDYKSDKRLMVFYKFFAILTLTLIFGLRDYSVGTDTRSYLSIFEWLGKEFYFNNFIYEKGFCFLSVLINKIFGSFTIFLLISGFIIYWNIVSSICELSESPSVSIACYFGIGAFAQSCNLLRQYFALSFCMIALYYLIKKNKIFLFIIFVFLGFLFHRTAIVFLIAIPMKYTKFNIITVFVVLSVILLIIPLTPIIVKVLDSVLGTGYSIYLGVKTNPFSLFNIATVVLMLICIYLLIIFRHRIKNSLDSSKEYEFYANMFLLFVSLFIISIFTVELIDRIAIYFMPSILFVIPIMLKTFKNYLSKFFVNLLITFLIMISVYLLFTRGSYGVNPYIFIG